MIAEDNRSYCSTKSWTSRSDGVQEIDLRSDCSWYEADADEINEELNVEKLLDGKLFTATQAIHEAQREPFQQERKYAFSWNCEDWHGNRCTVIGLGTAWSYDAIFKPESKHLAKDAVEAKRR